MKKILGIACLALSLSACVRLDPVRPDSGPGSGIGANYVPVVDPPPPPSAAFDAVVSKCQREAAGFPFRKTYDHDPALLVVDTAVAVGLGAWAFSSGPSIAAGAQYQSAISAGIVSGTSFVGMRYLFDGWVYSPQVAEWHRRQETQVANCMARYGYTNADPSVVVTYQAFSSDRAPARVTGKDTYTAEHLAKLNNCAAIPIAKLVSRGPGYENHSVACSNGTVIVVHCEFGNCRINQKVASN